MRPATGGPAFPRPASEFTGGGTLPDGNDAIREQGGMTLRQWYAGQALVGLLAADTGGHTRHVAQIAFEYADAMVAYELHEVRS